MWKQVEYDVGRKCTTLPQLLHHQVFIRDRLLRELNSSQSTTSSATTSTGPVSRAERRKKGQKRKSDEEGRDESAEDQNVAISIDIEVSQVDEENQNDEKSTSPSVAVAYGVHRLLSCMAKDLRQEFYNVSFRLVLHTLVKSVEKPTRTQIHHLFSLFHVFCISLDLLCCRSFNASPTSSLSLSSPLSSQESNSVSKKGYWAEAEWLESTFTCLAYLFKSHPPSFCPYSSFPDIFFDF